jgi:hypothetical protein
MTDAEFLYLVVACFYLAEGACWARSGMFVFSCQLGGRRQRRANLRWALLRNPEGGLLLGNLTPWGQASICQQWPLSLSPQGVYAFVSQAFGTDGRPRHSERFIGYEDIQRVESQGLDLLVNGVTFARLAVPSFARLLAQTIRRLAAMPEGERGPAIEAALARHLDAAGVQERLEQFHRLSADLQLTCSLLFFLVLLLPPLLVGVGSDFPLGALFACYFGLALLAILQFREAHRVLYPEETLDRWKHMLMMLVSPADVMHARDKLARPLLGDFSPLAVARIVGVPADFQDFAGDIWRDLEYPLLPACPAVDAGPRETEAWFRQQIRAQLGQFLAGAGVKLDELLKPPAPDAASSRSYCPRCLGQYVLASGTCADCGGRPLRAWGEAPRGKGDIVDIQPNN